MNTEIQRLREFKAISDRFITEVAGRPVPWLACAGPSTWQEVYGKPPVQVYVWEIDTTQVSAGKLLGHRHLLHDISTALGGVQVRWKNHGFFVINWGKMSSCYDKLRSFQQKTTTKV